MVRCIFLLILIMASSAFSTHAMTVGQPDSIGIETIEGKKFIVHKVEPKETLYALSRRYQVSVDDILTNNEYTKDGYAIDQIGRILYIPLSEDLNKSVSQPINKQPTGSVKQHTVRSGETLYALSRKYDISLAQLKKLNNLKSDQLDLGQVLIVSKPDRQVEKVKESASDRPKEKAIIHTVKAGETIYGISRQYEVDQDALIKWNNLSSNELNIGQKLKIQKKSSMGQSTIEEKTAEFIVKEEKLPETYAAKQGETYADVAEKFDLFLGDLEKWNVFAEPFAGGEVIKLQAPKAESKENTSGVVGAGADMAKVHVVKSGETIYSLSEDYEVPMEDLRKWNQMDTYQLSVGQKLYVKNPDAFVVDEKLAEEVQEEKTADVVDIVKDTNVKPKKDTKAFFTVEEEDIPKIEKVQEKGIAEVIEGSENTEKYLALHRTAKIGTIMQVRNDLNDQIVFVRVLGKLPDTGVDEKVIIRISRKAFQKLGGVDYKFPAEISYLPLND